MNVQTVYHKLQSRSKTSSVFCGIYAGIMWAIMLISSLVLGFAGVWGGSFWGKLNHIDKDSIVAGYQALGNLLMSALMGVAILVILACILLAAIPAVLYTIASVGGFSKLKKEKLAVQTPGAVMDFRLFKKDAVYKLVVSGLTIALVLWSDIKDIYWIIKRVMVYHAPVPYQYRIHELMPDLGLSFLLISPAVVVFVLAVMNLSDISKWRKWLDAVRAQNRI